MGGACSGSASRPAQSPPPRAQSLRACTHTTTLHDRMVVQLAMEELVALLAGSMAVVVVMAAAREVSEVKERVSWAG